jgi:hypothetical protein
MTAKDARAPSKLKTIGFTPFLYCSNQPLFRVCRDVPLSDALSMASDFLILAKELTREAAFNRDTDRHLWAAHYLTAMGQAVVDDVVKVLEPPACTKTDSKK